MNTFKFLLGLCLLFTFNSCYKYDPGPTGNNTGGGGSGSGGSGSGSGTAINCKACEYFPACNGSRYIYADTGATMPNPDRKDSIIFVKDTVIDGLACQKLNYISNAANNGFSYIGCSNGVTTQYLFNATTPGGQTAAKIKRVLLKANANVGDKWADTISTTQNSNYYESEIIQKNFTLAVNGVMYQNVIQVEVLVGTPLGGQVIYSAVQNLYFAKGVGLIYDDIYDATGTIQLKGTGLKSHYIP